MAQDTTIHECASPYYTRVNAMKTIDSATFNTVEWNKFMSYDDLSEANKSRARATFFNAGSGDGYTYEIDSEGILLCRKRNIPLNEKGGA